MSYKIQTIPAYRAIGQKWEGPWSEIQGLKEVIHHVNERLNELPHAVDPTTQLGLSYHTRPDGFTHYSAYEVTEEQEIPEGMIEINIPELTYVVAHHTKGEEIGQTYYDIHQWIQDSEYKVYSEPSQTYYDNLPIKHEFYPLDRDLHDPHFDIRIPVVKK